jgi:hypothetical protein
MKEKNSVQQRKVAMTGRRKGQAGQSLVLVALSLAALLGMVGMGIDMGFLRYQKGRMQAAADAAALAGGAELQYSDLNTAIQNAASVNGYTDGSNGITVTIHHPPQSGAHSADANYVEVILSQSQPVFFMNLLGVNSMPMTARAVGTGVGNYCVYGLATSGTSLFVQSASVTLKCPVVGDSNLTGSGSPATLAAPNVAIVGSNTGATVNPATNLNTGISTVADPFASQLTAPTVDTSCAAHPTQTIITASTGTPLTPGTYCGGILISTSGITVNFSSGTYVMYGGGLQTATGVSAILSGSGVTIYNTGNHLGGSCTTCDGQVFLNLAATSSITAPTASGSYEGILFYQDPLTTNQATLMGTGYLEGVYYFPAATLEIESDFGSSTAGFSTLVAKEVWWYGAGGSGGSKTWNDDDDFSHEHDGDPDHRRRGRLGGS